MAVQKNGNLWPDGLSLSWTPSFPGVGLVGVGGTYYWNPGSDNAPPLTFTGMYGRGRDVSRLGQPLTSGNVGFVFRRNGMTSADTLGYGTTSNVSTLLPSVTVNTSIPDENGIPQPTKNKVSSIEAGISNSIGASTAATYTATPQQIADFLIKYGWVTPAMGPQDELSPIVRTLQSGVGTVGQSSRPPVRFLSSRYQDPLGGGMTGWRSSVDGTDPQNSVKQAASPQEPGGLLGLLLEHLRNNPDN
jgi:hypothetical protein